jgi:hypothetical protein
MTRLSLIAFIATAALGVTACGTPPPDRIEIDPPTPIKATEPGAQSTLKVNAFRGVAAYDDSKAPLVVSWKTSDPGVADVNQNGEVTARGSGKAVITASVPGKGGAAVEANVDVHNVMVSTVEMSGPFPPKFRFSSPPVQLAVVVKDEKGAVVEKPKLNFRASDHCVEVTPDGLVHPLAVGECDVIVEVAGKSARVPLDVKE